MLDHLISSDLEPLVCEEGLTDFVGLETTRPDEVLSAQITTTDWLESTGLSAATASTPASQATARNAFMALTTGQDPKDQKNALIEMHMPEAIRQVTGMLTAYDWEFVSRAQELRSFVVARLVEETNDAKGTVRLKALELLGKVTEVGLFTDKLEVKKTSMTDEEINARIKDKIAAFLKIEDASFTDVEPNESAGPDAE